MEVCHAEKYLRPCSGVVYFLRSKGQYIVERANMECSVVVLPWLKRTTFCSGTLDFLEDGQGNKLQLNENGSRFFLQRRRYAHQVSMVIVESN